MSKYPLRIIAILLLMLSPLVGSASLFARQAAAQVHSDLPRATYVTPAKMKAWLDAGQPVTVLDVRQADEFAAGHIANAINIHYDQMASLIDRLPREQPIVVYCIHSAHRAPEAARTLQQLGLTTVYVLEGGIVAWQAEGLLVLASNPKQTPAILPFTERCANTSKPVS